MKDLYILKGDDIFYDTLFGQGRSEIYNRTVFISCNIISMYPLIKRRDGCFIDRGILLKRKLE